MDKDTIKSKRDQAYHKNHYDQIKFVSRKEDRLKEQIEIAARKRGITSSKYMLEAIETRLKQDGISIEDLPEQEQ